MMRSYVIEAVASCVTFTPYYHDRAILIYCLPNHKLRVKLQYHSMQMFINILSILLVSLSLCRISIEGVIPACISLFPFLQRLLQLCLHGVDQPGVTQDVHSHHGQQLALVQRVWLGFRVPWIRYGQLHHIPSLGNIAQFSTSTNRIKISLTFDLKEIS